MKKVVLICDSCGGKLEVFEDYNIFICEYCNTQYIIEQEQGEFQYEIAKERLTKTQVVISQIESLIEKLDDIYENVIFSNVSSSQFKTFFEVGNYKEDIFSYFLKIKELITQYESIGGDEYFFLNYISPMDIIDQLKLFDSNIQLIIGVNYHVETNSKKLTIRIEKPPLDISLEGDAITTWNRGLRKKSINSAEELSKFLNKKFDLVGSVGKLEGDKVVVVDVLRSKKTG